MYHTLKRRGMDLVTVTDHDSIDAAEPLRRFPDFFLSQEISCVTPDGTALHVGVYGISEPQHLDLARRRGDFERLLAYLYEERIFFSVNHAFSALTGRRTEADFAMLDECFPAMEVLNGQVPEAANRAAARMAAETCKTPLAGSDAHTLHGLGLTFTEVPGARGKREFLQGLEAGQARTHGEHGNWRKLTRAVYSIAGGMVRERALAALLLPLALLVPAATAAAHLRDIAFAARWERRRAAAQTGCTWSPEPEVP